MSLFFVVLSGFSMGLSWLFLYEAYNLIGVGLSSLAYYCAPVIVLLLSPLVFRERLNAQSLIGIAVVFAGAVLTNGAANGSLNHLGLLYGFLSALAHACMVIFSMKSERIRGITNATIQLAASWIVAAVYILISPDSNVSAGLPESAPELVSLIVLGLVNTGLGCYLYFSSIGSLSVSAVSILGYLEPLSAVILSALILHEHMSIIQWAGAVMIIGGAVITEKR